MCPRPLLPLFRITETSRTLSRQCPTSRLVLLLIPHFPYVFGQELSGTYNSTSQTERGDQFTFGKLTLILLF